MTLLKIIHVRSLALIIFTATKLILLTVVASLKNAGVSSNVYILRLRGDSAHQWTNAAAKQGGTLDAGNLQIDVEKYTAYLKTTHDSLLKEVLEPDSYEKLYSYTFLLNAVSVKLHQSATQQAEILRNHPKVEFVEQETVFQKTTTHTPDFLGLPSGAWRLDGGPNHAGENVVIGMLDTGINPTHPSFATMIDYEDGSPWRSSWRGKCVVADSFPKGSCNQKLVGAQYFSKGIVAANLFNASYDFASPLDGDGHGTHTSSIAAGNNGVPVIVRDYNYGLASGVAPRAR